MHPWATAPDAAGHTVGDGTPWGREWSQPNREVAMIRELVLIGIAACLAAPTLAGPPPCAFLNAQSYFAGGTTRSVAVGSTITHP